MDLVNIFSFMLVATLLVISPGPNGLLIAKTVTTSGTKAGVGNIVGFAVAFGIHGVVAIFGISIILLQSGQAFFIFKLLGAAYLCWIGIKSLISAWQYQPTTGQPPASKNKVSLSQAFVEGLLTNLLNPKVSMFYLAAFPQFIPAGGSAADGTVLVILHALINVLWFSLMVCLLARIKQASISQRLSRWLKSITGIIFIGFAAKLASLNA